MIQDNVTSVKPQRHRKPNLTYAPSRHQTGTSHTPPPNSTKGIPKIFSTVTIWIPDTWNLKIDLLGNFFFVWILNGPSHRFRPTIWNLIPQWSSLGLFVHFWSGYQVTIWIQDHSLSGIGMAFDNWIICERNYFLLVCIRGGGYNRLNRDGRKKNRRAKNW